MEMINKQCQQESQQKALFNTFLTDVYQNEQLRKQFSFLLLASEESKKSAGF